MLIILFITPASEYLLDGGSGKIVAGAKLIKQVSAVVFGN
jgi:hypothetical protein